MLFKTALFFCFCFSNTVALASGPGTTSANFLKIPVGARQTALGSAFTAVADDVNAVYYNPGGLAQLDRAEVTFVHNRYFEDISQQWLAGAFPSKAGVFGLGLNYLSISEFDAYDNNDNRVGSVSAYDMAANFSYANRYLPNSTALASIFYGANLKYLIERLDVEKASGFGLDLGILIKPKIRNLNLAFAG
ncbi:MAG: PorV/PorQ family protein, partial [bacterium]